MSAVIVEATAKRLVYRPWKRGSALMLLCFGVAILAGLLIWAQLNGQRLTPLIAPLLFGGAVAVYGLFYLWKNGEALIFDAAAGQIARKLPLMPASVVCRFSDIYALTTVSEMNTFEYVLTRKSERGGGDISVSDSFYTRSQKADRQGFETHILPVIESMLGLKAR